MSQKNGKGMTRRQFCGASIIGTIGLANMDAIAMAAAKKQDELDADIVIIGAGGAGFMAAVSAYEAGIKKIVILEKAAEPGGCSVNMGVFFAVNSPLQKRLGLNVTAEQAFREKMAHDHWRQDARLIRDTIGKSGEVVQWLEDKGLKFDQVRGFAGTGSYGHDKNGGVFGKEFIKLLSSICNERGIKILYDTPAKKLLADKQGTVTGVLAVSKDKEIKITAKGVILASGGFGKNKTLLKKYFPYNVDYETNSLPQMTGDGLLMAEEIGAIVDDQMSILLMGAPVSSKYLSNVGLNQGFEIISVTKDGERYYDESLTANENYNPDDYANTLRRQRNKEYYLLCDSAMMKEAAAKGKDIPGGAPKNTSGAKMIPTNNAITSEKMADTWEEIAEFIGADSKRLKETITRYNSFCEKGYDADFFKDPKYLRPINTPPYLAVRGHHGFQTTFGGIKINHRTEVLNNLDIPIRGLYAVGDCAGSWAPLTYSHRHAGSASSFALCSGCIAGENAAGYIKENRI
jgi:fumarate reductase flavoprotein subunit